MGLATLGRTLVIANPAAQSGAGEQAARTAEEELARIARAEGLDAETFEVVRTERAGQAVDLARAAGGRGFSCVVALGGDGIVHEAANGLMACPSEERPSLGVIAIGSGNDYARTLGLPRNKPLEALRCLMAGRLVGRDVGMVNATCFVETLSFGLDAAIALGTMTSRRPGGIHGTLLYAREGVDIFTRHRRTYAFDASFERADGGRERVVGEGLIFAVQVGSTYGGGFRICPQADPADGMLDVCRTVESPGMARTLALFFGARLGMHARSRAVTFDRVRSLTVDFVEQPPAQADGERLEGTSFEVACIPDALRVAVPQ